jgi:hypothetical protein
MEEYLFGIFWYIWLYVFSFWHCSFYPKLFAYCTMDMTHLLCLLQCMPHLRPVHSSQWRGKFELMNILEIQWWLTDAEAWLVKPGSLQAGLLLIDDGGSTTCKW